MNSHSRSRWRGSSAEDGSSSSSTGGSASRPTAMFTRWRLPPESLPSSSRARSRRPVCSSIRVDRRLRVGDLLQPREQPQVLGDRELRVDRRLLRAPSRPRAAARETSPASALSSPPTIDSSVVLPAPLGPITATSSPSAASKLTSRSATRSPKRLVTPRTFTCATVLPRAPPPRQDLARAATPAPPAAIVAGSVVPHGSSTRWRRR